MNYVGLVGHESAKFTAAGRKAAIQLLRTLLSDPDTIGVSGACHLGGIDLWARDLAREMGRSFIEFPAASRDWEQGFKPRNLQIATQADIVHCLVVDALPESFGGRRFEYCYHCHSHDHVKSGGCWTMKQAQRLGKEGKLHIIHQTPAPRRVEGPPADQTPT